MDDRTLLEALRGNESLARALGRSGEGAQLVERDGGVLASVVPVCPERSVVNSVAYADPAGLAAAYDEIAGVYRAAGVQAWTVWVPAGDSETGAFLAGRGHVLDAAPIGMGTALDEVVAAPGELAAELSRAPDPAQLGRLNDRAYGYDDSFERALGGMPPEGTHFYTALYGGEPVSGLAVLDGGSDAQVEFVATIPAARGRGLAGGLLAQALADARERGRSTTTLIATRLGRPVYERLGYRPLGTIEMWERRT